MTQQIVIASLNALAHAIDFGLIEQKPSPRCLEDIGVPDEGYLMVVYKKNNKLYSGYPRFVQAKTIGLEDQTAIVGGFLGSAYGCPYQSSHVYSEKVGNPFETINLDRQNPVPDKPFVVYGIIEVDFYEDKG